MQTKRIIFFVIMIAVGLGIGLLYGWIINPISQTDPTADTLRADYKTDYILMVSEIYKMEGNLDRAIQRLAMIDRRPAVEVVADGLIYARSLGYAPSDLSLIEALSQAFLSTSVTPEETDLP